MNKKILTTLIIIGLFFIPIPNTPKVNAAFVPGSSIPILDPLISDNTNLYFHTNYRYYPKSVTTGAGTIDLRDRSTNCNPSKTSPVYKTLPWLGYYNNGTTIKVSEAKANDMSSYGACNDRYNDGGVAPVLGGGFMPPEFYGGWARKGSKTTSTVAYVSAGTNVYWKNAVVYTSGNIISANFNQASIPGAGYISGVGTLTAQDSAQQLFQDNGYSGWTNISGEKLLSNGTAYFRKQFTMTEAQRGTIDSITLEYQADDFVDIYLNGVRIKADTIAPTIGASSYSKETVTINDALIRTQNPSESLQGLLSFTETNVLAFQLNDKATWVTSSNSTTTSNSNATGLKYKATFNQSYTPPPACGCSVLPTNGTAPVAAEVKIAGTNLPVSPTWIVAATGPSGFSATKTGPSPLYFNLPNAGLYNFNATLSGTSTTCTCSPNPVNVKTPTDGSGNETNP